MSHFDSALLPTLLVGVQVLGLISACLARVNRHAPRQQLYATLFMVALFAVGCSIIMAGHYKHATAWLFGGASIGTMVLVAVWENTEKSEDYSGH
jgi:peptidoglycan/LPS O-acetylase OafA/YrhL